jgi:hypothetical protein
LFEGSEVLDTTGLLVELELTNPDLSLSPAPTVAKGKVGSIQSTPVWLSASPMPLLMTRLLLMSLAVLIGAVVVVVVVVLLLLLLVIVIPLVLPLPGFRGEESGVWYGVEITGRQFVGLTATHLPVSSMTANRPVLVSNFPRTPNEPLSPMAFRPHSSTRRGEEAVSWASTGR